MEQRQPSAKELLLRIENLESRVGALEQAAPLARQTPAPPELETSFEEKLSEEPALPPIPAVVLGSILPLVEETVEAPEPIPVEQALVWPPPPPATPAPELPALRQASPTVQKPEKRAAKAPRLNIEALVGGNLLNRIGILALFVGFAFFLKLAIDKGWLTETLRIVLGVVAGLGMIGAGEVFTRKGYGKFAAGLLGGGIGILYFTSYAGYDFYHLFSATAAFAFAALVTAGGTYLSLRHGYLAIAILCQIGGFLTPAMIVPAGDRQTALFAYLLLLNGGMLFVAYRKEWRILERLGWIGSALLSIHWYWNHYAPEKLAITFAFATILYAFFYAVPVARVVWRKVTASPWDLFGMAALSSAYFTAALFLLEKEHETALKWVGFGLAAFQGASGWLLYKREALSGEKAQAAKMAFALAGLSFTFFLWKAFDGAWLTFLLSAWAAVLSLVWARVGSNELGLVARIFHAWVVARVFSMHLSPAEPDLLGLYLCAVQGAAAWLLWRVKSLRETATMAFPVAAGLAGAFFTVFLWKTFSGDALTLLLAAWAGALTIVWSKIPVLGPAAIGMQIWVLARLFGLHRDPVGMDFVSLGSAAMQGIAGFALLQVRKIRDGHPSARALAFSFAGACFTFFLWNNFEGGWLTALLSLWAVVPSLLWARTDQKEIGIAAVALHAWAGIRIVLFHADAGAAYTPFLNERVATLGAEAISLLGAFFVSFRKGRWSRIKVEIPFGIAALLLAALVGCEMAGLVQPETGRYPWLLYLFQAPPGEYHPFVNARFALLAGSLAVLFFASRALGKLFDPKHPLARGFFLASLFGAFLATLPELAGTLTPSWGATPIPHFLLSMRMSVEEYRFLWNGRTVFLLLYAALFFVLPHLETRLSLKVASEKAKQMLSLAGCAILFLWVSAEAAGLMDAATGANPWKAAIDGSIQWSAGVHSAITLAWVVYALALIGFGIGKKDLILRYAGLGLFGVAILKVAFVDLSRLETIYRVISSMGLGVLLIAASWAYHRFVIGPERADPDRQPPQK